MGGYRFIRLSSAEEKAIKKLQSERPSAQESRRLEGLLMSHRGLSIEEIRHALGVGFNTVGHWLTRWESEGMTGILNRPKSGRPSGFTPEEKKVG